MEEVFAQGLYMQENLTLLFWFWWYFWYLTFYKGKVHIHKCLFWKTLCLCFGGQIM